MKWESVELSNFMVKKRGSVNPVKFQNETFELYSIPAYDKGKPEILKGSEIGSSKKRIENDDILLSRIVPHIRRSLVINSENSYRKIGSGEWIIFNLKKVNPHYLRYFFYSPLFSLNFLKDLRGVGGSLMRANPTLTGKIKIPLPALPIQQQIADLLDTADELRRTTADQIQQLDDLAQAVFLEMFGDVENNPKDWIIKKINAITTNQDSKRIPVKAEDRKKIQGKYDYYGATGVIDKVNDYLFDGNYLLVAEDGKALVKRNKPIAFIAKGQFWVNNHAHVLKENGQVNLRFLEFFFAFKNIRKYVTGIDQYELNRKSLDRIPVPVPPIEKQTQFAQMIENIEAQKVELKQSLQASEDIFNGLLQEIFS